jgi:hypothetical protein
MFYIDNCNDLTNNKRGFHANINFNEILIVIKGSIKLKLIYKNKDNYLIEINKFLNKNDIHYIHKLSWIEYEILELNTEIFVLVDKSLYESKSINNFDEFLKLY